MEQQPLLPRDEDDQTQEDQSPSSSFTFTADAIDIPPINGVNDFFREYLRESKKFWYLAGPAIFISISRYSLGAIIQVFAGHINSLALAAVSVQNSIVAGFSWGILIGMGSALETLCGQAVGARQLDMLGVYLQRSWIILNTTALILVLLYIFSGPLLELIGESAEISKAAGTFAVWMIPQLFAYACSFPITKFLLAQSKIMVMALIMAVALVLHVFFSWLLMLKLGWALVGAAVMLNGTWWFIVIANFVYILNGTCGEAWSGFSWKAFENLWAFVRLSMASAVMFCLEMWYYTALILFAGYLKNPEISLDAWSICINILGWTVMMAIGSNAAVSVRVSNELGAGHPRTAKFSILVAVSSSFIVSLFISLILIIITRNKYPCLFSDDTQVQALVKDLTPLLALCIVINNIQPVLSGTAVGAGWQANIAYVNIGSYYFFGIPLGLLFGYKLDMGVKGIWLGMLSGTILQTSIIFYMIYRTNWTKEASIADEKIRKWGGLADPIENDSLQ